MRLLLPLLILGTIFFFAAALIAPRRSKRLQRWTRRQMRAGERQGRRRVGWLGDLTAKSLGYGRRWLDAVMSVGRRLRTKLPG